MRKGISMSRSIRWVTAAAFAALAIIWLHTEPDARDPPANAPETSAWRQLSPAEARIVESCGTEPAFSGKYLTHKAKGTYTCTRCGAPLFRSETKFDSRSGWPSFDQGLPGAIRELPDGFRTEIRCARCDGHLGHVFRGEDFTPQNTRHCVNSLSLGFEENPREEAFFAGGCFWGVEYLLESLPGVLRVESGYMGGKLQSPSYKAVSGGRSGHTETVRVVFDPRKTSYETLTRFFFEIHDPTQKNRQGPDIGSQYRSSVFVTNSMQQEVIQRLIGLLQKKGLRVVTTVEPAGIFWPAEGYHQDYYTKTGKTPYCHAHTPRF
jgi:peptide methionine sulfoxide reductase msrA/msrB